MEIIKTYLDYMGGDTIVLLVIIATLFDTIFGIFRAIKGKELNSSFGIDGGIRKACMLASICFLGMIDLVIDVNFIGFLPDDFLAYINLQRVGIMDFFGLMFFLYECLSILKNMKIMELPMPAWLQKGLDKLLTEMTKEVKEEQEEGAE